MDVDDFDDEDFELPPKLSRSIYHIYGPTLVRKDNFV
jgi:hypothetical protein